MSVALGSKYVLSNVCALVSGGFATVHPNNKLTINAVEAAPLEDFSQEVNKPIPAIPSL